MRHALAEPDEQRRYYELNQVVYGGLFARFYDAVVFPLRKVRREVAAALKLAPTHRVLDVATGTGEQALAMAEAAGEVVGVDLSEAMLDVARRKNRFHNVTFQRGDATRLPFADDSFEAACASFALHEMPPSVRLVVLREMARVTRPGGTIAVVDYALPRNRFFAWLSWHLIKLYERDNYAEFVKAELAPLLERAGIEVRERRPILGGEVALTLGLCGRK